MTAAEREKLCEPLVNYSFKNCYEPFTFNWFLAWCLRMLEWRDKCDIE